MATWINRGRSDCDAAPVHDEETPGVVHVTCPECPLEYFVTLQTYPK